MNDRTDQAADPELVRLLDDYGQRMHNLGETDDSAAPYGLSRWDWTRRAEWSRAALLDYVAEHYVRRPPVPALLPTPADVDAGRCRWTEHGWVWTDYRAARGILPWKPGDELPEERIRQLRDGAD